MYIDPGFGSLLFQAIAALAVACGAYFVATKGWFRNLFGKKKTPKPDPGTRKKTDSETDSDGFLK